MLNFTLVSLGIGEFIFFAVISARSIILTEIDMVRDSLVAAGQW